MQYAYVADTTATHQDIFWNGAHTPGSGTLKGSVPAGPGNRKPEII